MNEHSGDGKCNAKAMPSPRAVVEQQPTMECPELAFIMCSLPFGCEERAL